MWYNKDSQLGIVRTEPADGLALPGTRPSTSGARSSAWTILTTVCYKIPDYKDFIYARKFYWNSTPKYFATEQNCKSKFHTVGMLGVHPFVIWLFEMKIGFVEFMIRGLIHVAGLPI